MLKSGEILDGRYQVIGRLGEGGAGILYLGYHLTLCKYVVIKKIKENYVGNLNARGEADILKKLHHRYLPQVYDFLVIGTGVYTVMDYVDGSDLSRYVREGYIFTEDQLIGMLKQLCEVLEYMHGQKPPVIHSDIKPGNIMIRENGDVCLIDFNISLDADTEQVLGYSPYFAAPEQLALARAKLYGTRAGHKKVDGRSDLYSLGASFYYLMTGVFPSYGSTVPLKRMRTCYSKELVRIVEKAMELSRRKRYAGAAGMRRDLEHMHTRTRRLAAALLAALAAVTAAGGLSLGAYRAAQNSRQRFVQAFAEFNTERQYGEPRTVREQGMGILNDGKMKRQLEAHQEQKADILAGIAETYYEEENYSAAAVFYGEALSCSIDGARRNGYLRDYILALIRSGQKELAQKELEVSEQLFGEDSLTYLRAEFLLEEGKREEAYDLFWKLAQEGGKMEIRMRSALLASDCLAGDGRLRERMEALSLAQRLVSDRRFLRRIGESYVEIAHTAQEEMAGEALEEAESCYSLLCRDVDSAYLDWLNYVTVLEMRENYSAAFSVLEGMEDTFPEDYRTYREEAWLCYWMELDKDVSKRDFQGVLYYGNLACQRYTAADGSDEKMERLRELMGQLSR